MKGIIKMNDNCIFCKIIDGKIPSSTVYEDEYFKAIMDISPANKGHVVLLAKKHFENIYELDQETAIHGLPVIQKVAKAMREVVGCEGINILQNNGTVAGQTVFHYHVHLIPRREKDEVTIDWVHQSYGDGEAALLASEIGTMIQG